MKSDASEYIGYEYKEIRVPENQRLFYLDCYESLGWESDSRVPYRSGILTIRRDHKLINRTELTRLQNNFEACMDEIGRLEASKTSGATAVSITAGLIGCTFMAGSVFAVTADPPIVWLCVLLAIPGFAGWGLAPMLFRQLKQRRSVLVDQLIEQKYGEIYSICEKGHKLLL